MYRAGIWCSWDLGIHLSFCFYFFLHADTLHRNPILAILKFQLQLKRKMLSTSVHLPKRPSIYSLFWARFLNHLTSTMSSWLLTEWNNKNTPHHYEDLLCLTNSAKVFILTTPLSHFFYCALVGLFQRNTWWR